MTRRAGLSFYQRRFYGAKGFRNRRKQRGRVTTTEVSPASSRPRCSHPLTRVSTRRPLARSRSACPSRRWPPRRRGRAPPRSPPPPSLCFARAPARARLLTSPCRSRTSSARKYMSSRACWCRASSIAEPVEASTVLRRRRVARAERGPPGSASWRSAGRTRAWTFGLEARGRGGAVRRRVRRRDALWESPTRDAGARHETRQVVGARHARRERICVSLYSSRVVKKNPPHSSPSKYTYTAPRSLTASPQPRAA